MEEGKNETSAERAVRYKAERTSIGRETLDAESRMSKMINEMTGILSDKDESSQKGKLDKYINENIKPFSGKEDGLVMERIVGGAIFLSILRDGDDGQRNAIGMGSISEIEKILPEGLKEFSGKVRDHIVDSENLKLTIDGFYKKYEGSENSLMFKELLYKKIAETDVPEDEMGQKIMILATLSEKMAPGGEVKDETQETSDESDEDVDSFFEGMDGGGDRNEDVPEVVIETQETSDESDEDVDSFFEGMDGGGDGRVEDKKEKKEEIDVLLDKINNFLEEIHKDFIKKGIKVSKEGIDLDLQREFGLKFVMINGDGNMLECNEKRDTFAFYDKNTKKYFLIPSIEDGCFWPGKHVGYYDQKNTDGKSCEDGDIFYKIEKPAEVTVVGTFNWHNNEMFNRYKLEERGVARVDRWK